VFSFLVGVYERDVLPLLIYCIRSDVFMVSSVVGCFLFDCFLAEFIYTGYSRKNYADSKAHN
jgi:hypothetical protein